MLIFNLEFGNLMHVYIYSTALSIWKILKGHDIWRWASKGKVMLNCLMQFHEFAFLLGFSLAVLSVYMSSSSPNTFEVILKWAPLVSHLQFGCRGLIVHQSQLTDNLSSCFRFHLEAVVRTQTMDNPKANLLKDSDGSSG